MNAKVCREIREDARRLAYVAMCEEARENGQEMPDVRDVPAELVERTYRMLKKKRLRSPDGYPEQ